MLYSTMVAGSIMGGVVGYVGSGGVCWVTFPGMQLADTG